MASFASEETKFLEHIVSTQGICPDPEKVAAMQDWPFLQNIYDVCSFWV
jgi:hypothetical protein